MNTQTLREVLRPQGSADVIRMEPGYISGALVREAIADLESRLIAVLAKVDTLTPLERLGVLVLVEAAGGAK